MRTGTVCVWAAYGAWVTSQLVLQVPPAAVASMLGYQPARTELLAAEGGAAWKRYVAGDHTRR